MYEQNIRNILKTMLNAWIILIQLDKDQITSNEVLLVNSIYEIFSNICELLHMSGNYILDIWEQCNYNIDKTIDYIIDHNFEVVEENNIEE